MKRIFLSLGLAAAFLFPNLPAKAVVIEFSSAAMRPPIGSGSRGQNLENDINSLILTPQGLGSIEFGATDGGTSAVDSMAFEGSGPAGGLTVITGFGFIYRFDSAVSNVRVRFSNFKDQDTRWVHAFDQDVSYVRQDPNVANNQHILGNPITFPDLSQAIDTATGVLPVGSSDLLDLSVSGNISTILVRSNKFLWTLREIEFETASAAVPAPGAVGLLGAGMLAVGGLRRVRRGQSSR